VTDAQLVKYVGGDLTSITLLHKTVNEGAVLEGVASVEADAGDAADCEGEDVALFAAAAPTGIVGGCAVDFADGAAGKCFGVEVGGFFGVGVSEVEGVSGNLGLLFGAGRSARAMPHASLVEAVNNGRHHHCRSEEEDDCVGNQARYCERSVSEAGESEGCGDHGDYGRPSLGLGRENQADESREEEDQDCSPRARDW